VLYDIEITPADQEFGECWLAAARHLQSQAEGNINWLREHCNPPYREHLSFRMGNQLFFIRIDDRAGKLNVPGNLEGFMALAKEANGHPLQLLMEKRGGSWRPFFTGWGLRSLINRKQVNPVELITDERVEMSDWELHDFGVQIVRNTVREEGHELMTWTGDPGISPSLWFKRDAGPEYVVVRVGRYPAEGPDLPENLQEIAERVSVLSDVGHFASITVANADDAFDPQAAEIGAAMPLFRGHGLMVIFEGLEGLSHPGRHG
jgi:hypothetical protein